jgi:hypothetical protein
MAARNIVVVYTDSTFIGCFRERGSGAWDIKVYCTQSTAQEPERELKFFEDHYPESELILFSKFKTVKRPSFEAVDGASDAADDILKACSSTPRFPVTTPGQPSFTSNEEVATYLFTLGSQMKRWGDDLFKKEEFAAALAVYLAALHGNLNAMDQLPSAIEHRKFLVEMDYRIVEACLMLCQDEKYQHDLSISDKLIQLLMQPSEIDIDDRLDCLYGRLFVASKLHSRNELPLRVLARLLEDSETGISNAHLSLTSNSLRE